MVAIAPGLRCNCLQHLPPVTHGRDDRIPPLCRVSASLAMRRSIWLLAAATIVTALAVTLTSGKSAPAVPRFAQPTLTPSDPAPEVAAGPRPVSYYVPLHRRQTRDGTPASAKGTEGESPRTRTARKAGTPSLTGCNNPGAANERHPARVPRRRPVPQARRRRRRPTQGDEIPPELREPARLAQGNRPRDVRETLPGRSPEVPCGPARDPDRRAAQPPVRPAAAPVVQDVRHRRRRAGEPVRMVRGRATASRSSSKSTRTRTAC